VSRNSPCVTSGGAGAALLMLCKCEEINKKPIDDERKRHKIGWKRKCIR
jgi:hypothetical protein